MNFDIEIFEGKTYKDLLKDIVTNSDNKRDQIDIVISDLRSQIKTINDAVILAPIIQSYLDTSVKNDEQLIKLAAVVQRLISVQLDESGNALGLTEQEKAQILSDIKSVQIDIKNPIQVKKIEKK